MATYYCNNRILLEDNTIIQTIIVKHILTVSTFDCAERYVAYLTGRVIHVCNPSKGLVIVDVHHHVLWADRNCKQMTPLLETSMEL